MQIGIFELILLMLVSAFLVLSGAYFSTSFMYDEVDDEYEEEKQLDFWNVPVAPVQEETKKKKIEDDDNSFYQ